MARPPVRDDLALIDGYHSPQVQVDVRLNTNEAPSPPPAEFDAALSRAMSDIEWHRYPDRGAEALRTALAELHGLTMEEVFCANGSNEVLQTILLTFAGAGRKVLTFEPTYAMHGHIARVSGAESVVGERGDDHSLDVDYAVELLRRERPAVTFLCSPNNPTGIVESPDTIRQVLDEVEAVDGLLVVDEAYGQFAPWSAIELLDSERSLVVTRTFSKTWAMAGARLGYMLGASWIVDELDKVVLPYHLDSAKQIAGLCALGFVDQMEQRVATIVEERGRLSVALAEGGSKVWPSGANFILFRPPPIDGVGSRTDVGQAVWDGLIKRSVLVRNTSSWDRLDGCLRVTIGTKPDNDRFLQALAETLQELGA